MRLPHRFWLCVCVAWCSRLCSWFVAPSDLTIHMQWLQIFSETFVLCIRKGLWISYIVEVMVYCCVLDHRNSNSRGLLALSWSHALFTLDLRSWMAEGFMIKCNALLLPYFRKPGFLVVIDKFVLINSLTKQTFWCGNIFIETPKVLKKRYSLIILNLSTTDYFEIVDVQSLVVPLSGILRIFRFYVNIFIISIL